MRAVIRFLSRGHAGAVEQRDRIFEGEAITIGRATDQVVHLKDGRVALKHARIFRSGERVLIVASAVSGVLVNGAVRRDAEVRAGDVVQIGSNVLKFVAPPVGFDVAFTFELDAAARSAEALREPPQLDLANTRLNRRVASWALFIAIAVGALVVPLMAARSPGVRQVLDASLLPSDHAWSSGPLHSAHQNLATRCETCHEQLFVRVTSGACLECHEDSVHRHVGMDVKVDRLDARCAACHAEHNEPETLVRTDAGLCVSCHAQLERVAKDSMASMRVTDFAHEHPEFRVSQLAPRNATEAVNEWMVERETLGTRGLREQSRLKFPHDTHLDPKGIKAPDGTVVMQCAHCHVPEAGGKRMQSVRMEEHCQSCHRLDFEPADPARQVPHGAVARVVQTLNEYYSARYLEGYPDPLATARPERPVARPGAQLSPAERARLLAAASERAGRVARDLIERRTCQDCHVVEVNAGEGAAADTRWRVLPVLLTTQWMPKARFDHARHATTLSDCDTCHEARQSHEAADVLMPRIATCRECHGGTEVRPVVADRVASACTLCHSFHVETNPLWGPREHPSGFAQVHGATNQ